MNDNLQKGRKRASLGEVRVYSNQKWKKTSKGWELVKDQHKAKSDGHIVNVHTVTPEKVYFHVHNQQGDQVARGKMTHDEFSNNYKPVLIHHPNIESDSNKHMNSYYLTTPTEVEEPDEEEIEIIPSSPIESEDEDIELEDLPQDLEPIDEEELEEDSYNPYSKPVHDLSLSHQSLEIGDLVRFMTDGSKKEGRVTEIAPNGVLTIQVGSRTHYVSPSRLI